MTAISGQDAQKLIFQQVWYYPGRFGRPKITRSSGFLTFNEEVCNDVDFNNDLVWPDFFASSMKVCVNKIYTYAAVEFFELVAVIRPVQLQSGQ